MSHRGPIALILGVVAILGAGAPAWADDVTLNVPVQVGNMAVGVTRGRVECRLAVQYSGAARDTATGQATGKGRPTMANGHSDEFALDTNGAYNGTVAVRVQIGPTREMIDSGLPITIEGQPTYECLLQTARPGGNFYPEFPPRDMASGQSSGRSNSPEWARPRAGSNPTVTGRLTVPTPPRTATPPLQGTPPR
ncbi:MAG TPA: hypothetical protein VGT02_08700 [Methylomirabilota bacterium]|jgi:hypothetical protein|nr:hypothetical protein [Methylomirabilota bacterium]